MQCHAIGVGTIDFGVRLDACLISAWFALVLLWPASAAAITDGLLVQTCAFPSVVLLHGERSGETTLVVRWHKNKL